MGNSFAMNTVSILDTTHKNEKIAKKYKTKCNNVYSSVNKDEDVTSVDVIKSVDVTSVDAIKSVDVTSVDVIKSVDVTSVDVIKPVDVTSVDVIKPVDVITPVDITPTDITITSNMESLSIKKKPSLTIDTNV